MKRFIGLNVKQNNQLSKKYCKQLILLLPLCALGLLCGCARRISIKTTAYSDSTRIPHGFEKKKTFAVKGDSYVEGKKQNNDELETKELEKKISIMLENKGYLIDQSKFADYFLIFNYGCKAETVTYNALKYLPGPFCQTNATLTNSYGYYGHYNQTTSSGTFFYVPEQCTYYTKFLRFYVYDKSGGQKLVDNPEGPGDHLWSGFSYGVDEYADLRIYLDFLLISMFNSFGCSGESNDVMYEGNESVKLLRQQMTNGAISVSCVRAQR